ncbi:MAG: DbpA RNA binding domain-containing protein, partial [Acholeplasmatales bacterium]|nr:DbpA RNA binding domain-containing protein [Acholeplasmatales bacterium]
SMVDELVIYLQTSGIKAEGLHGDLKQISRDKVMQSFRTNTIDVLICTDVAARGIDIDGIDCVINYDIPNENELYVHRIGRTGRAGASGISITFSTSRGKSRIKELESYTKQKMIPMEIPTVKQIKTSYQKKLYLSIEEAIEKNKDNHEYDNLLAHLARSNSDPMPLLTALLSMVDKNTNRVYNEIDVIRVSDNKDKDKSKKNIKGKKDKKTEFVKFEVNLGKKDNVRANMLVVFFHDELKIHREHFGRIDILENKSIIEVNKEAIRFLKNSNGITFNKKKIKIKLI